MTIPTNTISEVSIASSYSPKISSTHSSESVSMQRVWFSSTWMKRIASTAVPTDSLSRGSWTASPATSSDTLTLSRRASSSKNSYKKLKRRESWRRVFRSKLSVSWPMQSRPRSSCSRSSHSLPRPAESSTSTPKPRSTTSKHSL